MASIFINGVGFPGNPCLCRTWGINVAYGCMYSSRAIFTTLMVCSLVGCVAVPRNPEVETVAPRKVAGATFPVHIAVLPFANSTSNSDGPVIVRAFVVRKLEWDLGYIIPKVSDTDETLTERELIWSGHPGGRQLLSRQDPVLVASWLSVEGLLYGELTNYSRQSISLYAESKVSVHFWLTDASGKKIWESQKENSGGSISLGSASLENILGDGSLPPEVQDRVRHSDVSEPAYRTVEAALADFPGRH
jgi:hypothetical protein